MKEEAEGAAELVKESTLVVGNDAEYAKYLQRRVGFTVVDQRVVIRHLAQTLWGMLKSRKTINKVRVRSAFALAADRSIETFLEFTGRMRPPVKGGPWRPAHFVGWADITTHLAQSYYYKFGVHGPKRRREYIGIRYDLFDRRVGRFRDTRGRFTRGP